MARFVPLSVAFAASFVSSMPALAEPATPRVSPKRMEALRHPHVFYPEHGIYYSPATDKWSWSESETKAPAAWSASYRRYSVDGAAMDIGSTPFLDNLARVEFL